MEANLSTDFDLNRRQQESIAQGALTNSKRPVCLVKGVYPTHLARGDGPYVYDTLGKRYIDFICGLGANLLGYGHPEVGAAIKDRIDRGITLSLSTDVEVKAAEKVKEFLPFVDQVKFMKTGTEACIAALRIARAKTGRKLVYTHGYHGWSDEFVSMTPPALGVAGQFHIQPLPTDLAMISPNAAAVIVEPVMTDNSRERVLWLKELRAVTKKHGIMLIFDEIITGFRFPKASVSIHHGIEPDLICLGKAIANGMPLSVVAGKRDIMSCGEYFVSSTFAGETASLAAALKTMQLLQVKYNLDDLWEQGRRFISEFNSIWPEGVFIQGYPTRGVFQGEQLTKALFWQEACRAGILFGPSFFFAFPHIGLTDVVLSTCKDILNRVKGGQVLLLGELPRSPFAQKLREEKRA